MVFDEIRFSQKSLTHRKKEPHTLPQQVLLQQNAITSCQYYKPRAAAHTIRCYRKKTKILKNGARGDRGSPDQNESSIPDLSNVL